MCIDTTHALRVGTAGYYFQEFKRNAPIVIRAKGLKVSNWTIVNGQAGMLPSPGGPSEQLKDEVPDTIELIPYGCTTLRISQFPVLK